MHNKTDFMPVKISSDIGIPHYLEETYWWAYTHPNAVKFFERQWLVNLILWGNFTRLRDTALDGIGHEITGRTLQVACVYGDFSQRVAQRLVGGARLDIMDVAPVQLFNARRKLKACDNVTLLHQDSTAMSFSDHSYDNVIVFFLLHEQPPEARIKTVREAWRVTKPGGRLVFVDYHRPHLFNPFRYIMLPILKLLEPFALDMWKNEIRDWLPAMEHEPEIHKSTAFGGLYQQVVIRRS